MNQFAPQLPMSEIYMNAVIKQLQQNMDLDKSQAKELFEKYYRPVYKYWGMEPNVEEFAEKIQKIDDLVSRNGTGGSLITFAKTTNTIDKEELIEIIKELPEEKLLLIYKIVKEILNAPELSNLHSITKNID